MKKKNDDLPIFVKWYEFLKNVLLITDKFPKSSRFTFVDRIQNLALDGLSSLVSARYSKNKLADLTHCNLALENLRILFRICHELQYLSHKQYEGLSKDMVGLGKMLGGWIGQQQN
jgi:hypothetical protein